MVLSMACRHPTVQQWLRMLCPDMLIMVPQFLVVVLIQARHSSWHPLSKSGKERAPISNSVLSSVLVSPTTFNGTRILSLNLLMSLMGFVRVRGELFPVLFAIIIFGWLIRGVITFWCWLSLALDVCWCFLLR